MVLALLNGLGGQDVVELIALGVLIGPLLHGPKHIPLDLDLIAAEGGVMEGAKNVVDDLLNGDVGVFPGI